MNKSLLQLDDKSLDKAVKISGTQYDRRRRLTDKQIARIHKLFTSRNKSIEYLANKFKVDSRTIRYHLDSDYRKSRISQAKSRKSIIITSEEALLRLTERANYKRTLIRKNKI